MSEEGKVTLYPQTSSLWSYQAYRPFAVASSFVGLHALTSSRHLLRVFSSLRTSHLSFGFQNDRYIICYLVP